MKNLRLALIVLGALAVILLGITQLGGTPIYKGYDTGFKATATNNPMPTLTLSNSAGDLNCWLEMKLPASSTPVAASMSNNVQLSVYHEGLDGSDQWIAIVAQGFKREEKFNWPAGTRIFITFKHGDSVGLSDWRAYLGDKDLDSQSRAKWRTVAFYIGIAFLAVGLAGTALEVYDRNQSKVSPFTHERGLEQLILNVEGKSPQETKWMQSILTKVLLLRVSPKIAIASLPLKNLKDYQKLFIWFRARDQFLQQLTSLINDFTMDIERLGQL
jgi:hypothetical protein